MPVEIPKNSPQALPGFMVTGPLGPFANIPTCIEESVDWIVDAIAHMRQRGVPTFEATEAAKREWAVHVTAVADDPRRQGRGREHLFAGADIEGRARAIDVYFGGANAYFEMCRNVAQKDYEGFVLR